MQSEQAYYFGEFVRFAFGVLPIGLLFLAMIFLRRRERTSGTRRLTWLSAVWLLAAVAAGEGACGCWLNVEVIES
jgi:hypothetical protein